MYRLHGAIGRINSVNLELLSMGRIHEVSMDLWPRLDVEILLC